MAASEAMGQIFDGPIGIFAPKYVCLDTKIMILGELEAEILRNLYISRPFWKMAAIKARGQICDDPITKIFS